MHKKYVQFSFQCDASTSDKAEKEIVTLKILLAAVISKLPPHCREELIKEMSSSVEPIVIDFVENIKQFNQ
ncbi:hypothetical protein HHY41_004587 [Salmonella enterica]|uniref:hypothetical protein n=1 Tax=Salmonella enterica TaxID=28901 RepID=UPI000F9A6D0F|nr:hypothetical protein [Salmonella enterica]EAS0614372.1 hypothetical protein [Salmonella enterica subsp. enterica serovar Dahomey]EBQ9000985.1 hypothetical protein [Salmonella enterica subsp. enterica serovar Blockley]EBR0040733.1 hypothetical protein [Salmonella enterica subsp. enterica serovar Oranienburg]EBS0797178.1 hypothetical protein [Salmonella enterica subsp. enterica serovar Overschie]ECB6427848.1 hypothetical protein [Salmonella enterica subsp. enterica serovar Adelaide]ECD616212